MVPGGSIDENLIWRYIWHKRKKLRGKCIYCPVIIGVSLPLAEQNTPQYGFKEGSLSFADTCNRFRASKIFNKLNTSRCNIDRKC